MGYQDSGAQEHKGGGQAFYFRCCWGQNDIDDDEEINVGEANKLSTEARILKGP